MVEEKLKFIEKTFPFDSEGAGDQISGNEEFMYQTAGRERDQEFKNVLRKKLIEDVTHELEYLIKEEKLLSVFTKLGPSRLEIGSYFCFPSRVHNNIVIGNLLLNEDKEIPKSIIIEIVLGGAFSIEKMKEKVLEEMRLFYKIKDNIQTPGVKVVSRYGKLAYIKKHKMKRMKKTYYAIIIFSIKRLITYKKEEISWITEPVKKIYDFVKNCAELEVFLDVHSYISKEKYNPNFVKDKKERIWYIGDLKKDGYKTYENDTKKFLKKYAKIFEKKATQKSI